MSPSLARRALAPLAAAALLGGCGRQFDLEIVATFSAGALPQAAQDYPLAVASTNEDGELLVRTVLCAPFSGVLEVTQNWTQPGKCQIPASIEVAVEDVELADPTSCDADAEVLTPTVRDDPAPLTWTAPSDATCEEVDGDSSYRVDLVF
jgi:hypothetical protein